MNTKPDGGPAFPTLAEHGFNTGMPGMTLRDAFALQAMHLVEFSYHKHERAARHAYEIADAMLAARDA